MSKPNSPERIVEIVRFLNDLTETTLEGKFHALETVLIYLILALDEQEEITKMLKRRIEEGVAPVPDALTPESGKFQKSESYLSGLRTILNTLEATQKHNDLETLLRKIM